MKLFLKTKINWAYTWAVGILENDSDCVHVSLGLGAEKTIYNIDPVLKETTSHIVHVCVAQCILFIAIIKVSQKSLVL